jgi:hypothetical protein
MASTSEGTKGSLRHVGEGTLDDSDSDKSDENNMEGEDGRLASHVVASKAAPVNPSPLSKIGWTDEGSDVFEDDEDEGEHEDEDEDDASPSPCSTNSDYGGSDDAHLPHVHRSPNVRVRKARSKTRSRSSTVAMLAAPPMGRRGSPTSVRTVMAESLRKPGLDQLPDAQLRRRSADVIKGGDTKKGVALEQQLSGSVGHRVRTSHPLPGEYLQERDVGGSERGEVNESTERLSIHEKPKNRFSDKRIATISADEQRFNSMGWDSLRDTFEIFADGVRQMHKHSPRRVC